MKGKQTTITDSDGRSKSFGFDYSYWSHDGYKTRSDGYLEPDSPEYADQKRVFDDLGRGVLDNAWKGYNCSLFAYGQTGSGKSYSIIGYGVNKGIVPITCGELFEGIELKKSSAKQDEEWQVSLSMVEIYNEKVRDLLISSKAPKDGLKVRQHQIKGFYVEGLSAAPVSSYAQIEAKIAEGSHNRSVAATNMNTTSSRAHTIVAITFVQKARDAAGQNMTKSSVMNLVDLAGSERIGLTGATGDRMKEGAAINLSLTMLGNCIKALADQAAGNTKIVVPFRDSVLTKLLQNALGGNSKTVMIAALSPADINYEETLSTLRFADRAKSIKTRAVVNESPTDKLIRELREENARLLALLKSGGALPDSLSEGVEGKEDAAQRLQELMKKNQEDMEAMEKTWAEKLAQAQGESQRKIKEQEEQTQRKLNVPHLWNLNEDPSLSGLIVHFCDAGKSLIVGREGDVQLAGLSIHPRHASLRNNKGKVTLTPIEGAKVYINGKSISSETELHHNDRVLFGSNHLYIFHHPVDYAKLAGKKGDNGTAAAAPPTFEEAQAELATNSGIMGLLADAGRGGNKEEYMQLKDDLVKLFPEIQEANAMSQEMSRRTKFELLLMSPQGRGLKEYEGRTEVYVKLINQDTGVEYLWPKDKFAERKYVMRDLYNSFMEGDDLNVSPENDPFWEVPNTPVLIGTTYVYMESLSHLIEASQNYPVINYRGDDQGKLGIEMVPCDDEWNEQRDSYAEPESLVGKQLKFKIKIGSGVGLPAKYASFYCQYKFDLDSTYTVTQEVSDTADPLFNFEKTYPYGVVTQRFLNYLQHSYIIVELWGRQKEGVKRPATKALASAGATQQSPDDETQRLKAELETVRKEKQAAEAKVKDLQRLVNDAEKKQIGKLEVSDIDKALTGKSKQRNSTNADAAAAVEKKREALMGNAVSRTCSIQ